MLELIAKYEKEDQRPPRSKRWSRCARMEAAEANKASIERKHAEQRPGRGGGVLPIKLEKTSPRKREQEEKEIQDEKNRLAKAMLDSQEKIMDNSAVLDALRARRYAEAKERAAREAVLKKETWRKNLAESVHKTLGDQIEDKKRRQAREAALQEREHDECLRYANKVQDREAIENERKRDQRRIQKNAQRADARRAATAPSSSRPRTRAGPCASSPWSAPSSGHTTPRSTCSRGYNPNYLNEIRNCDIQKIQMR